MGRLDGKVAVITGATSGIGLRTAEVFVAEGAKIVIAGRRIPEGEALAKQLGANCIFRQTEVTVEAQMQAVIALAVEKFGRIDCLFNNAGGPAQTGGIEDLEVERFDAAMATLVRSVMLGMKHAAPYMMKQGGGSIINLLNIGAKQPGPRSVPTSVSRAAGMALMKALSKELDADNIRVNGINIGLIKSGQNQRRWETMGRPGTLDEYYAETAKRAGVPLGRVGEAEEVGDLIAFLCSARGAYISGVSINMDGGSSAVV